MHKVPAECPNKGAVGLFGPQCPIEKFTTFPTVASGELPPSGSGARAEAKASALVSRENSQSRPTTKKLPQSARIARATP